jgi:O-acetyl-ADP-ribose deacetylase (regulator of RNase III)
VTDAAQRSGSVQVRRGDLLADPAQALVNPVNCLGVMGAGLAAQFRRRWPAMYADYRATCQAGRLAPGRLHLWGMPDGRFVVNLPTKQDWRHESDLAHVSAGIDALRRWSDAQAISSLAIPALGCGLGGLPWPTVRALLIQAFDGAPGRVVTLYAPFPDQG